MRILLGLFALALLAVAGVVAYAVSDGGGVRRDGVAERVQRLPETSREVAAAGAAMDLAIALREGDHDEACELAAGPADQALGCAGRDGIPGAWRVAGDAPLEVLDVEARAGGALRISVVAEPLPILAADVDGGRVVRVERAAVID